jgi:ATP-dependent Clp protease ATP-binding subunit ClpA
VLSKNLEVIIQKSIGLAKHYGHAQATTEHLLLALCDDTEIKKAFIFCSVNIDEIRSKLIKFLETSPIKHISVDKDHTPEVTFQKIIHRAAIQASLSGVSKEIMPINVLTEIFLETSSFAAKMLHEHNITRLDLVNYMTHNDKCNSFIVAHKTSDGNINRILIARPFDSESAPASMENMDKGEEREAIKKYCVNLNKMALEGKIDVLIGRETEIERTIEILCRRTKNNPLLVGEPGVGKTAIVEGLAHKISHGKVLKVLANSVIYSLDLGALLAGTRYRGDFEERIKLVINELSSMPHAILFIDEIHSIIGAGSTNGNALDASNLLKPALARGQIRCIGSTTHAEYYKHFAKDKSLVRRFQQITVDEPTTTATISILNGLRSYYEKYHNVHYTPKAIEAAVFLSKRYINDKQLPDKAIDIIDETGAYLSIHNPSSTQINVTVKDIEHTVARMARIPTVTVSSNETTLLKGIDDKLKALIFGQNPAVEELCNSVRLARAGLRNPKKPMGCYMFAGPTGVGKTELAIQLAKHLGMKFIRFDMSEYLEKHSVAKMVGSPPGYVGYDTGGLLTEEISKNPYSVVLLDEIEKAHKDIYNITLQIMDYGTLTDHQGKKVSFHNAILIMTTNAGAASFKKSGMGFDNNGKRDQANLDEIEKIFSPELRNRLDGIIHFKPLSREIIAQIVDKFLNELREQLTAKNIELFLSDSVTNHLIDHGYDEMNGARKMERIVNEKIKKAIANEILFGKLAKGGQIRVDMKDGAIVFFTGRQGKNNKNSLRRVSEEVINSTL